MPNYPPILSYCQVAVKALTSCPHSLFYPFLNRKASFLSRTHRFQDETKKTTAAEKQLAEVTSRRLNDEQLMKMVEEKFAADEKCYKNIVAYNQQLVNSSLKVAQVSQSVLPPSIFEDSLLGIQSDNSLPTSPHNTRQSCRSPAQRHVLRRAENVSDIR